MTSSQTCHLTSDVIRKGVEVHPAVTAARRQRGPGGRCRYCSSSCVACRVLSVAVVECCVLSVECRFCCVQCCCCCPLLRVVRCVLLLLCVQCRVFSVVCRVSGVLLLRGSSVVLRSGLPVAEDRRVSEAVDVVVELRPRQHRPLVTH